MSFRVLVSDKLDAQGIAVLEAADGIEVDNKPGLSPEEQAGIIGDYQGLIVRLATKLKGPVLEAATNLKVVVRAGIGVDNIDIPGCTDKGILVENTPFGNAISAAEHAFALLLSLARHVPQASASTKAGKWEKSKFEGVELDGKTLGLIGAGNIGAIVARKAIGFGMSVVAFDPVLTEDRAKEIGVEKVDLDELLKRADAITLHVPLIDATKHLLNEHTLDKCKTGVLIVNASRGGTVDEAALGRALESGKVRGAALDVFETEPVPADHPLLGRDDVILTPHLGASTSDAQVRVAVQAAEQIVALVQEKKKINALNAV